MEWRLDVPGRARLEAGRSAACGLVFVLLVNGMAGAGMAQAPAPAKATTQAASPSPAPATTQAPTAAAADAPTDAPAGPPAGGDAGKAAASAAPAVPLTPQQKELAEDTAKLLELANELKVEMDKSTKDTLSLNVVKKADQIERLARKVRAEMKASIGN